MKIIFIFAAIGIFLGAVAGYYYWQNSKVNLDAIKVEVQPIQSTPAISLSPPMPSPPVVRQELVAPKPRKPLPLLVYSDNFVFNSLASIINNKSLMDLFISEHLIQHIVTTIDNLTERRVPKRILPIASPLGSFITATENSQLIASVENEARYVPYVQIVEAADPKKVVDLYVHLYPLFQEAYAKLGYPDKSFNERLLNVLDDLLAAPDIKGPIKLIQPNVLFLFADSDLEQCTIGQKIIMRMGEKNEVILKFWLHKVKQEVMSHVKLKKLVGVE